MNRLKSLIPDDWEPREALRFCAFLEILHDAIWRAHGTQMGLYLEGLQHDESIQPELPF